MSPPAVGETWRGEGEGPLGEEIGILCKVLRGAGRFGEWRGVADRGTVAGDVGALEHAAEGSIDAYAARERAVGESRPCAAIELRSIGEAVRNGLIAKAAAAEHRGLVAEVIVDAVVVGHAGDEAGELDVRVVRDVE